MKVNKTPLNGLITIEPDKFQDNRGFCVLSDWADLHYKVSTTYDPVDEGGLLWRDENIGIQWPIDNPIISYRDDSYPLLVEL